MIESKIDWDSAPEWADRLMQSKSGKLFWCNVEKYLYSLDRPSGTPIIFGSRHSAYTIGDLELTEMRPVEDKVEWDGKGSMIGKRVRASAVGNDKWKECLVKFFDKDSDIVVVRFDSCYGDNALRLPHRFLPIKTAEEKEREAFYLAVVDACMGIHKDDFNIDEIAGVLFHADFKAPKGDA